MEERGNPAGLRQAPTGEEEVSREGGRRQGLRYGCPPSPPLYIGAGERGEAQPCPFLQERGAAKRGGGVHPPQGTSEVPSPFRTLPFPYLLVHGPLGLVPLAHIGQGAHPYSPCGPPGLVDPRTPFGTPGTIPIMRETFPATKIRLPIYKSLPPELLVTSGISSGTPNNFRVTAF